MQKGGCVLPEVIPSLNLPKLMSGFFFPQKSSWLSHSRLVDHSLPLLALSLTKSIQGLEALSLLCFSGQP